MSLSSNYPVLLRPPPSDVLLLNNAGLFDGEIPVNYLKSVIMDAGEGEVEEERRKGNNTYLR